jgi:Amt family ammonium transporter
LSGSRAKNAKSVLLKTVVDNSAAILGWWAIGFVIAFGGSLGVKYDSDVAETATHFWEYFCGHGPPFQAPGAADDLVLWLFHFTWAANVVTTVSACTAERCKLHAFGYIAFIFTALVYPFVAHWVWSPNAWLASGTIQNLRYYDLAGSGPVHVLGGFAGFVGTVVVGPRHGFHSSMGENNSSAHFHRLGEEALLPQNLLISMLGFFLVFSAWNGWNCGAGNDIFAPEGAQQTARIVTCTILACCGAGLSSLLCTVTVYSGTWDLISVVNGFLGGLVAISAGCAVMEPWAALVTGLIAGVVYQVYIRWLSSLISVGYCYLFPLIIAIYIRWSSSFIPVEYRLLYPLKYRRSYLLNETDIQISPRKIPD